MALVPLNHLLSSPAALVHRIRVSEFGGIRTRRARVSIPMAVASTYIPAAPILLPEGPWTEIPGGVTAPKGFKAAGIYGGLRAKGNKPDLSLVTCEVDAAVAGSFTTNIVTAAPVIYCKNVLDASTTARAILINAGQANAATGDLGYQDAVECANALAELLNMRPEDVLLQSTGVIGQRIKKDALLSSLPRLVASLSSTVDGADSAAIAITTTDLVSKSVAVETEVGGVPVRVGGMAKGSGMINPNMATMLGVVTTDAGISSDVWKSMVRMSVDRSFNQITVDGDTSTNDCVLALASGLSGSNLISSLKSNEALQLQACLDAVMQGLAKSIAWDGEGATCLIEVSVIGATGETEAAKIAHSVASSSLVKAAIYGRDPNWGRIACAVGYAGVHFDLNDLMISLGDIPLMRNGQPLPFDRDIASKYLRVAGESHGTVHIYVSVGNGEGSGKAWGCDLSYDYVKINAEYTT
ncbi:arginine biosynthesis bifunctional protein ArgJ, chloroplastic-like [Zingiber officinale]|uniref:arginine biosynthesis bifunctional protein ArgJ, chloroplastic-like n=1 Tax=Zingiber officinale TaxID=94328 RepID=UPI001C4C4D4C|nr:arginine biosynthesis bifunctional protein ArgJ, chloroplastic-like [Zingiber officinale]